jgi:uncharacterized cupin superfamily protein
MIEEREGWFVVNVKEASWYANRAFGRICNFENPDQRFPQTGVHLYVLEPGKPNCRYHRESAQEDFLVLSGECLLLVNGEEKRLRAWDYVHCPPNVTHVFVGAGDGPCVMLAIGHRPGDVQIFYPESELARSHGAEAPQPTPDPKVAYSDVPRWEKTDPQWPIGSDT